MFGSECDKKGVIPRIGIQEGSLATEGLNEGEYMRLWIPACAGMTRRVTLIYVTKYY
ncbi:MAG: hypothetical protein NTU41_00450 [Chloroflexi bacterium]|nr:hypothetical protein [Chloroflexota bacterium]